ncbi:MAG TPA: biotin/lipoyl-containing protein [Chloroflexota bacterium]|nr:biotin/lipoyl-containing protein [Chloroflexota bacterium]
MIVDLKMPEMGEGVTEGTIAAWLKQPGETVKEGEVIAELMTEKVNVEFPSPVGGKLLEVLHEEGDVVKKDQVIARLETS